MAEFPYAAELADSFDRDNLYDEEHPWKAPLEYLGDYVNLITNPNFESDTAGWSLLGGSVTMQKWGDLASPSARAESGTSCLRIEAAGSSPRGVSTDFQAESGKRYYSRVLTDVESNVRGIQYRIQKPDGTYLFPEEVVLAGVPARQVQDLEFVAPATGTYKFISVNSGAQVGTDVWFIDNVMVVEISQPGERPRYFDGDMEEASWSGTPRVSTSKLGKDYYTNLMRNPSSEIVSSIRGFSGGVGSSSLTNMCPNPSFENNLNNWSAGGGEFIHSRVNEIPASNGSWVLKSTYDGSGVTDTNCGYFGFASPAAGLVTGSIDIWIPSSYNGGQPQIRVESAVGATSVVNGTADLSKRDQWQRMSCSAILDAADLAGAIVVRMASFPTSSATGFLYYDAALVNVGGNTRYFDGNTPGFAWSGTANESTSIPAAASVVRTNEWSSSGQWSSRYRVTRYDPSVVGLITRSGSGTIIGVSDEQRQANGYMRCLPGAKYGSRIKLRFRTGVDVPDYVRVQIAWFKYDGTASTINSSSLGVVNSNLFSGGEVEIYGVSQAPADAALFDIRAYIVQDVSANGKWQHFDVDLDDFLVTRVSDSAPIDNSAIESDVPKYFDGSLQYSSWKGQPHASASWKTAKAMKILDHGLANDGPGIVSDMYLPDVYTDTHSILKIRSHPDATARYGIWSRVGNPGTPQVRGYLLQAENGGISIHYRNGAVFENLVGAGLTLNSGDSIGFSVVSNKLEGYHKLAGSETWTKILETEHDFLSRGVSGIYAQAGATNPNFSFDDYQVGETAWEYSEGTFGVREMRTAVTYQSNDLFDIDVAVPRYEVGDAMMIAVGARQLDPNSNTITPPDGWHLIGNSPLITGVDPGGMWVYAKQAEEGDDTAKFTFSVAGQWQAIAIGIDGAAPDFMETYTYDDNTNAGTGIHHMPIPNARTDDPMLVTFGYSSRPGKWEKENFDVMRQARNGEGTNHTTMMGAASITTTKAGDEPIPHMVRWVDELGKGQADFTYFSVLVRRPYYKEEYINDWDDEFNGNTIPNYGRAGDWLDDNYLLEVEDGTVQYKGSIGAAWGGFHLTPKNVIPAGDHVKVTLDYSPDTTSGGDGAFGVTAKSTGGHLSNERIMAVSYSVGYIELYKQIYGRWYLLDSDYSSYSWYNPINDQEFVRLEMEVDGNEVTVKRHIMNLQEQPLYTATVNYTLTGSNARKFGAGTQGTAGFLWAPQTYFSDTELGDGFLRAFNITNFTEKIAPDIYTVNFIKKQVWRWFLANSSDMSIIKEIRNARDKSLQVGHLKPGGTSFGVPLNDGSWAGVQPLEHSILCTRKDDPIWSGPIWTLDEDLPTNRLAVTATGWQEILNHRILRADRNFSGMKFTSGIHYKGGEIIQDLINEQILYGYFPITFGSSTDQMSRQRNFTKGQTIGSILQELSDIEAGFDFTIDPITRAIHIKNWDEYNDQTDEAFFAYNFGPRNLQGFRRTFDASSMVNRLTVRGQFGASLQEDTVSMADLGIMFEEERSLSGVVDPNILMAYAGAEVALMAYPKVVYSISPFQWSEGGSVPEPFVDYGVGDLIMFSAKYPPRVMVDKQNARVWAMTVSVDSEDNEKVTELQVAR